MIIHIYIIVLYMHYYYLKKFEDFNIFLAYNNYLILLKKVEKNYLILSKIVSLC